MRPVRLLLAAALTAAACASAPALAAAAPPDNDNYLASTAVVLSQSPFTATADTTEATTQPDLFNPNRDGQPLGGGAAEPTTCNGTSFGKTVWYDVAPPVSLGMQLRATAAFAASVAIYQWNPQDSKITKLLDCSANATTDDVLAYLEAGKNYTIQVGGVGGTGGPVSLKADLFPDQDNDGILDEQPDKCVKVPGIERFGGCPPQLKVNPSIGFDNTSTGIVINKLNVDNVPKGAKVVASCGSGCGSQTVKAKRFGRVKMTKLLGKSVRAGRNVEVRVTLGKTGTGTYKYGATGSYFAWPVKAGGIGSRLARCLNVKTSKIETCK
jgi:hypothetical protein